MCTVCEKLVSADGLTMSVKNDEIFNDSVI